MAGTARAWWNGGWKCCSLLMMVVMLASTTSSILVSTGDNEASSTLVGLVNRILQNLPSLKQALVTPRSSSFLQERSGKGYGGDSPQTPAPALQCFQDLGCLSTGDDFYHPQYRTLNLMAETREVVGVSFKIHTREAPQGFLVYAKDVSRILASSFRPERPTKIIIHGYLNGRNMPWLEEVGKALLEAGDYNVVNVDWTGGSLGLYSQAVANARLTALEIISLIHFLANHTQMEAKSVHIIGHSLGAHLAGYVGERVLGLGRITGLDPAEPFFQFMPPAVRLDPSDALLVDVIHTDAGVFTLGGGYGLKEAVGHLDFYPNGGVNQPGCAPPISAPLRWLNQGRNFSTVWDAVEDALGCNHIRAVELFLDSIRAPCPYVAFRCPSFTSFNRGECFSCGEDGSGCVSMGLHADSWQAAPSTAGHQLYLATGPQNNLCMYHYRALLEVEGVAGAEGLLQLAIVTPDGHTVNFDLTSGSARGFQPGKHHTFLLQHSADLNTAVAAHLTWHCPRPHTCHPAPAFAKLTLLNLELLIHRSRGHQRGLGASRVTFCGPAEGQVTHGETQVLPACPTTLYAPLQPAS